MVLGECPDPRAGKERISMRLIALSIAAVAVLSTTALAAVDPGQSRESYVDQVEPICKTNTEANSKILKGVRAKVRDGKLKAAAAQFAKAAGGLRETLTQLV